MKPFTLITAAVLLLAATAAAQPARRGGTAFPVVTAPGITWRPDAPGTLRGGGPPNDDCASVTAVTLPVGGSITFTGDNTDATDANDFEPGSPLDGMGACVWHKFTTAACANITVSYCATSPAFGGVVAFLSPSCPVGSDYLQYYSYNYTDCGNGNGTVYYMAVPAGTWYLPVMMNTFVNAVGPYSITVTSVACPQPPANDECDGAVAVTPQPWCNFATFTSNGATESMPAAVCGPGVGFANDDVWFSFTASASTMAIGAMGAGDISTGFNVVMELFSGTCGNLTPMACADDSLAGQAEQIVASALAVGQTYHVRVYDWNPGYPTVPDFGFCVVEGDGIHIGMPERGAPTAWSLYPNPGSGTLHLRWAGPAGPAQMDLMDLTGRMVRTMVLQLVPGQDRSIDLHGLGAGDYLVRLTVQGERSVQRVAVD